MNRSKCYNFYFVFSLVVFGAICLRLIALNALKETPYYTFLLPDERYYHDWAMAILKGQPFTDTFEYAPLPAYLTALVYRILTTDIFYIRVANIFFNITGCLFVFLIAREIVGKTWALLSFAFAACSAELVFYSVVPLKTSLSFFLFALFVYLAFAAVKKFSWQRVFSVGLVLGAAMTVRPNVLIFLPTIIPLLFYFNKELLSYTHMLLIGLTLVLGFLCTALPFTLHNYLMTGKFAFLPVQSGFLLYCTNSMSNPTPFYRPVAFASSHPQEQGIHFVIEASKRSGNVLTAQQASKYWQFEILKEISLNPQQAAKKLWQKTCMLFSFSENSDHYNMDVMAEIEPFFKLLKMKFWFFMVLGYSGFIFGFRQSKKICCLSVLCLTYFVTLVIYSNGNRFFLPVLALLIPSSTWLIRYIFEKLRARTNCKVILRIGVVLIVFALLGQLPVKGAGDLSKHYNTLAYAYKESGNMDLALRYWQKSSKRKETYSDIANLFLAADTYQKYGPERAVEKLRSIPDSSFMSAAKYSTLGDIYIHHNKLKEALQLYKKSLSKNFGQIRVREEIISILSVLDPDEIPGQRRELEWVSGFFHHP